jgi:transposase
MYIESIPNRTSPPCILLRESFREGKKIRKHTVFNLSKAGVPPEVIEGLRVLLRGGVAIESLEEAFEVTHSQPYGHVVAVLGILHQIGLDRILALQGGPERDRVIAMVVARLLAPESKLATARGLDQDAHLSALTQKLGLDSINENQLYAAMDWLYLRQTEIENRLASRHLHDGCLVLYDVTSTYFEGRTCSLAQRGHSRDKKKGTLQIVFGLLCSQEGCPVAVEVFAGNTGDPKTLGSQIRKVRERFGLNRVVFVGDRGMLTSARIDEELRGQEGLDWISALKGAQISTLFPERGFQYSLFDQTGYVEILHPKFPGERLIVCRNPLLAEERARKREALLQATEKDLEAVVQATQRSKRKLKEKGKIGLRVGRLLNRFKVGKHFILEIEEDHFSYRRNQERIEKEAALDGLYVVRTSVPQEELTAEETVRAYKGLSAVERAFRSCKTVDLHVRPIRHSLPERVRAHVFLCMLAYYVEWHMRQKLAPLIFDDEDKEAAERLRQSVVEPAQRSERARKKASSKRTEEGFPVHSFQTLLTELASLSKLLIQPKFSDVEPFEKISNPNPLQQRAFDLLDVTYS